MSPEYRVFVRPEIAKQFETMAESMGVGIEKKRTTQQELRDVTAIVWGKQRTRAYALLEQFRNPDSKVVPVINTGVARLIGDIYDDYAEYGNAGRGRKTNVDWEGVRQALIDVFETNLPETAPEDLVLSPDKQTILRKSEYDDSLPGKILPKYIEAIIRVYALNGIKLSRFEIAEEMGVKTTSSIFSSSHFNRIKRKLARNPELKNLVLETPQTKI